MADLRNQMVDFSNGRFVKLRPVDNGSFGEVLFSLLVDGEKIVSSYKGLRDGVVFTSKRIISINVQGLTGKKKDFTSLPYSKIQAYSVETAGSFDWDSELDLWFSGVGKVRFEFVNSADVLSICKIISNSVLL